MKDYINKVITLDTETEGFEGPLKRIAIYDGEEVVYGYTFDDIEYRLYYWYNKGYFPHIYIHNLEFDLRKLPFVFDKRNILWSKTRIINGRYVRVANKDYYFHDSFRLLDDSLANLSRDFGVEHGKLDLWSEVQAHYPDQYKDIEDYFIRCDKDDPIYVEYLGYDVMALYEVLQKLCDVAGIAMETLPDIMTTASLSKYIFRHGYKGKIFGAGAYSDYDMLTLNKSWSYDTPIDDNYSDTSISYADIEAKIRQAYFGGRTEVIKPELTPGDKYAGYHYDVNSLYPYACYINDYPIGRPQYYTNPGDIETRFGLWCRRPKNNGLGFVHAKVYVPPQHIPPLPIYRDKLVFLTGYLDGWWTYPELQYAVDNCGVEILEYIEMIHFRRTYPVYREFIQVFASLKQEADEQHNKALRTLSKRLMNLAYGYTCMRRDDKTALQPISKYAKYKDRIVYVNNEMGYIEYRSYIHSDTIQVQVGTYVTSYARLILLDAMRKANTAGDVYYCDTDSIVCSHPLPDAVVHPTELGKWKLEGKLKAGIFLRPKVYVEVTDDETNIRFKGVTRSSRGTMDYSTYEQLLMLLKMGSKDDITVERNTKRFRSLKYSQKKQIDYNYMEEVTKSIKLGAPQKRMMDYINNTTRAWHMDSYEMFYNFKFRPNYEGVKAADGSIINPAIL